MGPTSCRSIDQRSYNKSSQVYYINHQNHHTEQKTAVLYWQKQPIGSAMKTKNILLLVLIASVMIQVYVHFCFMLILAVIQDQALVIRPGLGGV